MTAAASTFSKRRPRKACLPLGGLKCQGKGTGMAYSGLLSDKSLVNTCFVAVGSAPNIHCVAGVVAL